MRSTTRLLLTAATVTCLPLAAQATGQEPPATPAAYPGAFEGYRPFVADEVQDWRKSNDTVREIGGWRAYAREIQQGARESAEPTHKAVEGRTGPAQPHPGHSQ